MLPSEDTSPHCYCFSCIQPEQSGTHRTHCIVLHEHLFLRAPHIAHTAWAARLHEFCFRSTTRHYDRPFQEQLSNRIRPKLHLWETLLPRRSYSWIVLRFRSFGEKDLGNLHLRQIPLKRANPCLAQRRHSIEIAWISHLTLLANSGCRRTVCLKCHILF